MSNRIGTIIAFLRDAFRNDGAEGESVHALCDAYEAVSKERDALAALLEFRNECCVCKAQLLEPDEPNVCMDCSPTDEQFFDWHAKNDELARSLVGR